jgi:transcription elongation GreA/GreB family factor
MTPEIQKAIEAGKLSQTQGAALARLEPGSYVLHKSWGFGQIDAVDFLVNQMTIHFKTKRGHSMQLSYAADSLQPIAPDHILAQKSADIAGVRSRAKDNPVTFMQNVLRSFGGKATQDQITGVLVPDVFSEAEFKRWWEAAKKLLRKDGHFAVPVKKGEPFLLREERVERSDEHLVAFTGARQLKDQIGALERILKDLEEFTDPAAQLQPIIYAAEETARKNAALNTAEALQMLLARDEMIERAPGLHRGEGAPTVGEILRDPKKLLVKLLAEIPAAKLRRVVSEFPRAFDERWVEKALDLVTHGNARLVGEAARLLQERGKTEELRAGLDRAIRDHSISSAALLWLCDKKERKGEFTELIHPRVLSAIISALDRDQFLESRDRKLHDLLVNDKELIPDLIADASAEDLREVMRKLMLSPLFEEVNKRALLGRIVRLHPEVENIITGAEPEKQEALVVSWESLEKRRAAFEDLVTKQIPANTQEISIARSYGDLRENAEFKAAKEMQRVLMRRQAEGERELALARGTDFANPDTTQVSIGTTVTLRELQDGTVDTYHILGAWDSDPARGIVSYKAAIAQALLGHRVGEQVEVPTEHGDRIAEIVSIAAWKKAETAG